MRNFLKIILVVAFVVLATLLYTRGEYRHWGSESKAWEYVSNRNSKRTYYKYLKKYPNGEHISNVKSAIADIDRKAEMESAYNSLMSNPTLNSCQNFLNTYPGSLHEKTVRKKIQNLYQMEAIDTYGNNSLWTGAAPYSSWYGDNYSGLYYSFSTINVTAPVSSDVIVIIKRNNSDGDVAAHGYICAGGTLSLDVPNGRYQAFFYYGKGWNPEKQMHGVRGGFIKDEVFSKADPEYLSDVKLSYVLQLTGNGNFRTKPSSSREIF